MFALHPGKSQRMMPGAENIPLADEMLQTMRAAAQIAVDLREPFITPRTLLLALLDSPEIGDAVGNVVDREKVRAANVEYRADGNDTLSFKTPGGERSVWLSKEALHVFMEGAKRARSSYSSRDLVFGLAADARTAPGILSAIRVEPGLLIDAVGRARLT